MASKQGANVPMVLASRSNCFYKSLKKQIVEPLKYIDNTSYDRLFSSESLLSPFNPTSTAKVHSLFCIFANSNELHCEFLLQEWLLQDYEHACTAWCFFFWTTAWCVDTGQRATRRALPIKRSDHGNAAEAQRTLAIWIWLKRCLAAVYSFLYFLKIKISKIYVRFEIFQKYTPVALP